MTDNRKQPVIEEGIERTLRDIFPSRPQLPDDFEQRVMSQVNSGVGSKDHRRRLTLIMLAYWTAFGVATGWVLSDVTSGQAGISLGGLGVVGASLALIMMSAFFLARQSRLKLSEIFFRTII